MQSKEITADGIQIHARSNHLKFAESTRPII